MNPGTNDPAFWNRQYDNGQIPWDLGGPTPVFQRLLQSGQFPPGEMIVLGAGRGHDARLFAGAGFTVTAVDFAPEAAAAMRAQNDQEITVQVMQADIFSLPADLDGRFDYLLEYTCYCAIDPRLRENYYDLAARLLRPGGTYLALAFPIGQRPGGPPFVVSPEAMIAGLANRGFSLQHREKPADSVLARQGVEELLILRKNQLNQQGD